MTNKVSFFSLFVVILVNSQQKKTTYFDKSWKETTKDKAAFYRPAPVILNDSIEFIRDYFINGKLQYQGYSLKKENDKKSIGSEYWYDEKGLDNGSKYSQSSFKNVKDLELKFYYPNGKLWKIQKPDGKKAWEEIYFENGSLKSKDSVDYQSRTSDTEKVYWNNSNTLAYEKFYNTEKQLVKIKNYKQDGTLISEINADNIIDGYVINHEYFKYDILNGFAVASEKLSLNDKISVNQSIDFPGAHFIVYGKYSDILQKKGDEYTFYTYKSWISDDQRKNRAYTELENDDRIFKLKDIQDYLGEESFLLDVNKIKKETIGNFKKEITKKVFSYYDKDEELLYKYFFPTPEIMSKQVYKFEDNEANGFGYHETGKDDHEKKWRLYYSESYPAFIFNFQTDRPIISFKDSSENFFIPLEDGYLLNNINVKAADKSDSKVDHHLDVQKHYTIVEENGKKKLYSVFGNPIISDRYDEILMNDYFIITKKGSDYSIYDSFLNKLNINNIKSVYLKGDYINVLYEGKVRSLNSSLEDTLPKKYFYMTCSQDPNTYYKFSPAYDKNSKRDVIVRIRNRWDSSETESYALKNLPQKAKLNYIYNDIKAGRKDILHYFKYDNYDIEDFFITAEYQGKKGLFSFDKEKRNFVRDSRITIKDREFEKKYSEITQQARFSKYDKEDEDDRKFRYYDFNYELDAITLLPMQYDDIIFRDELIIFYKDKKYGVYKLSKEPKYKKTGIRKDNFLEITNEKNQQGWLDLATNTEYYN
ncbi:hypothetical protein [Chryseobacterium arthrosphaerae]|uniref:hypothetical protein n=1 Tax=Chryseobacterium arthrosphaerae TaxID=651561 RepID=UPI001F4BA533|nr:hypothetical protein [Chryseobacterium arthrosphaerae]